MHTGTDSLDYNELCKKIFGSTLDETVNNYNNGASVVLELPAENYFLISSKFIKHLTNNGLEGIYLSFQRPYDNISNLFKKYNINKHKISIIDCLCNEKIDKNIKENTKNQNYKFERIIDKIINKLNQIKGEKKFIIIDSLTTICLYKSEPEIKRFTELLIKKIFYKNKNIYVFFNVAEDLVKKQFIKDISKNSDKVINIVQYAKKYSQDVIDFSVLT